MTRLTMIGPNPDWRSLNTLPTERTYIIYLDPALNYAVRRSEERYGDTLLQRIDHEKFRDVGGRGVWLPLKSTTSYYFTNMLPGRYYSEPILFDVSEVTELSGEPVPENQFVLQSVPGEQVFDRTVAGHAEPVAMRIPEAMRKPEKELKPRHEAFSLTCPPRIRKARLPKRGSWRWRAFWGAFSSLRLAWEGIAGPRHWVRQIHAVA